MSARFKKKNTLLGMSILLANAILPGPTLAAPDYGIHPYLGASYGYDDNLLRFSDGSSARAATGSDKLSDSFWRADGGFDIAGKLSEQVFSVKLDVNHTRYDRFDTLDYDGRVMQALWNWHVASLFAGNLGLDYERTLTPFSDYHGLERNLRTTRHAFVDGQWRFHPSWSARLGYSQDTLRYEQVTQVVGNRNDAITQAGLSYEAADYSNIGVQYLHTRGAYPDAQQLSIFSINNDYRQDAVLAKIDWHATPVSRLFVDAGWLRRRLQSVDERTFYGPVARVAFHTEPSGKTELTVGAWREVSASGDVSAIYTVNRGVSLNPVWNMTSKLKLEATLMNETLAYSGSPQSISVTTVEQRRDRLQNAKLTLSYAERTGLALSLALYRDRRHSNLAQVPYQSNGLLLNARYQF